MPSIESSDMLTRKHDDSCGWGVPALNSCMASRVKSSQHLELP